MAFIKVQKLVYDSSGTIVSGSASVVESVYIPGKASWTAEQLSEFKYHMKSRLLSQISRKVNLHGMKQIGY